MSDSSPDAVIVGAGLAGLAAAVHLTAAGRRVRVLESSDSVGGRQHTDVIDGFRIDRGFAIHNSGYPEARRVLDHDALRLRPFTPGALVHRDGKNWRVVDPHRVPSGALITATSPILSLRDKVAIGLMSAYDGLAPGGAIRGTRDVTTRQALRRAGISDAGIATFMRPFLQGVLVDAELMTSARFFHLVWRSFARGTICVPADGIQAISQQLADRLPPGTIELGRPVSDVAPGRVGFADGETAATGAVVVAADPHGAARLLGDRISTPAMNGLTTIYHVTTTSPLAEPILLLDADQPGLVANTTVLTQCAPSYSADGRALIETSVIGDRRDDPALVTAVTERVARLYGITTGDLDVIAVRRVDEALPAMPPPFKLRKRVKLVDRLFVCGDHRDTGSIQGSLVSGRRAAEVVLADLQATGSS